MCIGFPEQEANLILPRLSLKLYIRANEFVKYVRMEKMKGRGEGGRVKRGGKEDLCCRKGKRGEWEEKGGEEK